MSNWNTAGEGDVTNFYDAHGGSEPFRFLRQQILLWEFFAVNLLRASQVCDLKALQLVLMR